MSTSLNFWHYNKWKTLLVFLLSLIAMIALLYFIAVITEREYDTIENLEISFVLAVLLTLITVLSGISSFRLIKKAAKGNTNRSILPLFDSDVSIEVINTEKKISFAEPIIKGTISGLPVIISFIPSSKPTPPQLNFRFYPLSRYGGNKKHEMNFNFGIHIMNMWKDPKPEVLQFVEDLKAKGYTSAD